MRRPRLRRPGRDEPYHPPLPRAPRGCVPLLVVSVLLAVALLAYLAQAWAPRFPGADPF